MLIANPIYDSVFKYLLDDNKVARLLLSKIIDEEIIELEFRPKEFTAAMQRHSVTVYRLDFSAKIKNPDGSEKLVLVEIQKAKFSSDIMRFRRYLGEQYANKENIYIQEQQEKYHALPIITLYFLGHSLAQAKAPVIKVDRKYIDITTGEEIKEKEEFIESLTHDSYIIQIPSLTQKRQSELLQVLSIFDQSNIYSDQHIINVDEEDFPEKYRPVIRRLQKANLEPEVRTEMDAEDEFLEELESYERTIEMKEKTIEQKERTIEQKEKTIAEKDKLIAQLQQKLKEIK